MVVSALDLLPLPTGGLGLLASRLYAIAIIALVFKSAGDAFGPQTGANMPLVLILDGHNRWHYLLDRPDSAAGQLQTNWHFERVAGGIGP
jgi:hypothetical protein